MATKRRIAREHRIHVRYADQTKRDALRDAIKSPNTDPKDRIKAVFLLQKRPRDESPSRWMRRCQSCGRTHAVYRKFRLCRLCIRDAFSKGYLPGVVKSSW